MKKYLEAGKIVNTHALNGYVKFQSWCDSLQIAVGIKVFYLQNGEELRVSNSAVHQNVLLIKFDGVDSFEDAIKLKDKILYCDRADIPLAEGSHFITDLIGLNIIDADNGVHYGVLKDILKHAANDIYEIEKPDKTLAYVPVVKEFVINIDLEKGIFIRPIEGMFE
ncbi:MAG: ribosome maturation factor RimM [Oscillospiraceae bacterium]|nr:ribosome maturation factor RimM [Oscillospiraceae bacterium]